MILSGQISAAGGGGGGTNLPELTNPATAKQIMYGYEAIDQNGSKMTGQLLNACPEPAEIKGSWLPIELDSDSPTGETWEVNVTDKQIRAGTFMGAMISLNDDYILPIIMVADGTNFGAGFAVPLANSGLQCALADVGIIAIDGYVESIDLLVQDTFDLSNSTSNLLYDSILYVRPNPT